MCTKDAPFVQMLKEAGAIILVKGNLPQVLLSFHSENRIWGTAKNPFNRLRSCGGSSGGEAGLVAARCIPFGIGSDLGGSIRIPCEFSGTFGFKATSQRVSTLGFNGVLAFNEVQSQSGGCIRSTLGPITNCVDDLITGMRVLLHPQANRYDPFAPPMPFKEGAFVKAQRPFRVGYCESFDTLPASASARRAVRLAKESLERQGFTMVKFDLTAEQIA